MKLHHARFLFTERQRPIGFDAPHDEMIKINTEITRCISLLSLISINSVGHIEG